jgi:hypothetical protein
VALAPREEGVVADPDRTGEAPPEGGSAGGPILRGEGRSVPVRELVRDIEWVKRSLSFSSRSEIAVSLAVTSTGLSGMAISNRPN